jgi:uncharacterized membrane protein
MVNILKMKTLKRWKPNFDNDNIKQQSIEKWKKKKLIKKKRRMLMVGPIMFGTRKENLKERANIWNMFYKETI